MSTELRIDPIPRFHWPKGYRCAVAIGWHVDGESGPIGSDSRNADHLAALSMGQYGVTTAMPRILDIHKRLGIPGSFFVPGYVAETNPEMVRDILSEKHEIAYHGYMHENVFNLSETEERNVFSRQIDVFEQLAGCRLSGWSAPGWGVRNQTLNILLDEGIAYDSSLMDFDRPYLIRRQDQILVEIPISMVLDDYEIYGAALYPNGGGINATAQEGYDIYREEFEGLRHFGGVFATTFHPCILGRPGRLLMFERLLKYMKQFEDVWFATYEEIAHYVKGEFEIGELL